jgi:hypothetical protein
LGPGEGHAKALAASLAGFGVLDSTHTGPGEGRAGATTLAWWSRVARAESGRDTELGRRRGRRSSHGVEQTIVYGPASLAQIRLAGNGGMERS